MQPDPNGSHDHSSDTNPPIRRRILLGGRKDPEKKPPDAPAELKRDKKLYPQVSAVVKKWIRDEDDHAYDNAVDLYRAIVAELGEPQGGKAPKQGDGRKERHAKGKDPWPTIVYASGIEGGVQHVDWKSFDADGASVLLTELLDATVQASSNTATTACHGNSHGKLPKPVVADLAKLPSHEQPDHTDYIEFLIRNRKSEFGIERGIIDRVDGSLYLTAHYTKGSFVQLVNAPQALVTDWQEKAEEYCQFLTGEK